jgi:hypothetical protein
MATLQKWMEMTELSPADKEMVLRQIERLLSSSHFKNSRRYTDLLRFVVKQTIEGRADTLKERTLGIEVFGREPSFDTSGDSIVRVAAAEVRKRIAQYYQEEGHEDELRVDLPSGSYVAHFRWPSAPAPTVVTSPETSEAAKPDHTGEGVKSSQKISRRMKLSLTAAAFLLPAIAAFIGFSYLASRNGQSDLLGPLWKSPQQAIICIGNPVLAQNQPGADGPIAVALGQPATNNTVLPFSDAMTLSRLQVLLQIHRKPNRVQLARNTAFNDLRTGPAILIGALDNPWTMRLTEKLRFHFIGTDSAMGGIVDSKAEQDKRWIVDFHVPYSDRTQDYAIVAITHDDTLDQPLLIVAGVGPNGTAAAGEFLLNKGDLEALARMAPPKWSGMNVEAVLATQVIQGNSGPPQIVAAEYW